MTSSIVISQHGELMVAYCTHGVSPEEGGRDIATTN